MLQRNLKLGLGALVLATHALTLHAQMAQDPLLSRTASVEPNVVFLFDDSASMMSTAIYQYGPGAGYQGNTGPNDDAECLSITSTTCIWSNPPSTVYGQSPDVNRIYYDPRVQYARRIEAGGNLMTAPTLAASTTWNVYFYKPATRTTYSVSSVTVNNGGRGYPAGGFSGTFPVPPSGGTQASWSATTLPTNEVSNVAVASGGAYPTNPGGQPAVFSAPSSGVQATATVVSASSTNGISGVNADTAKRFTAAAGTACTVSIVGGGGSGASISAVVGTGTSPRSPVWTVVSGGSGYSSGTSVTTSCGGTTHTGYTVNRTTMWRITGVNFVNRGTGYTSPPSVTFPAATGSGARATAGTVTLTPTYYINAVTVSPGGSGYNACPALNLGSNTSATVTPNCSGTTVGGINATWDGTINPNGLTAGKGPVKLGDYFNPGYTPDAGSPLAAGATVVPYPNTASSAVANYPKFINRKDCAGATCLWADELKNYANWRAFHRTRLDLAKTGIGLAFQPLNPTFRLGWGTLGQVSGRGSTSSSCGTGSAAALDKGVRLYSGTTPSEFFTWLYGINGNVLCTPSRMALDNVGKYYQRADANGPWATNPTGDRSLTGSGTVSTHATCRRAYSMLMTDGYYNDPVPTVGEWDSTAYSKVTKPSAYTYQPVGPYADTGSTNNPANTFADVAMKYYLTDLRPDLDNFIKTVPGDEAYWQHMNFYAIGLGVLGTLDSTNPSVLQSLTGSPSTSPKRTKDWPTPPAAGDAKEAIDDMWHATVNARGKLLNAKTSDDLNTAITQMMSDIGGKEGTQAGVAVSTASLTKDTKKYTPTYTPVTWTGNLTAFSLNEDTANQSVVSWEVEKLLSTDPITKAKTYSSLIPDHAARNIYVGNGATTGARAVAFTHPAMVAAGLTGAMTGTVNLGLINYLRGDKTNEDASPTAATALYRHRPTRLGDIVNSTPVFVKDSVNLKYELLPDGTPGKSTYAGFVANKKSRAEGVIFVGANDGMLHAFRDGTFDATGAVRDPGGIEVFAYVPRALLPTLNRLSDKTYVHRYYVDGPNTETDAYVNSRWTNIVLGSTGAGSGTTPVAGTASPRTAVYAIDTTSLNTSVTTMDASNVMWEVSSSMTGFSELGYVLTDIQAGVTVGGQWVAIFGNGYESRSCQARLFVVNLETGALIKEINTGSGSCGGTRNGLGGVRLVKNAAQQVVGVYAGDLRGNMWKFNLNNPSSALWGMDLGGAPLFTAAANQPITAPPSVLNLPMVGTTTPASGQMVMFGTGKFYEVPDITNIDQQALYGIWDPAPFGALPIAYAGVPLTDTTRLVAQTFLAPLSVNGSLYSRISSTVVDYSAKRGWYLNLGARGERLVYPLDILADRFLVVDTISPANVSLDPCANEMGGAGFLYIIDGYNGGGPTEAVLDTNGDNNVDSKDEVVSGLEGKADGRNVTLEAEKNELALTSYNVSGGDPGATLIKISCKLTNTCKVTPPTVRRQWRQLFLR